MSAATKMFDAFRHGDDVTDAAGIDGPYCRWRSLRSRDFDEQSATRRALAIPARAHYRLALAADVIPHFSIYQCARILPLY